MSSRKASCSCGQLKVTTEGDPIRVSVCHCHACQKRTGSAFGVQSRWPDDKVKVEGRSTQYVRTGDSGGKITFDFCPDCGATVFFRIDQMAGTTAIPVGAFADSSFPPPKVSIYEARRHAWATLPPEVERLD